MIDAAIGQDLISQFTLGKSVSLVTDESAALTLSTLTPSHPFYGTVLVSGCTTSRRFLLPISTQRCRTSLQCRGGMSGSTQFDTPHKGRTPR